MAAERKLKNEIDRTLKKVLEGQEVFDDLWKQVHELDNSNQREKLEGELKKEIKKLQRLREQVKSWIQTSDIKDKQPLLDCRKSIEKDMERFKACEKESKMKGYGSNAHNKLDPQERAKEDAREWISNVVESLAAKAEQVNDEMEELAGSVKKKQKPPARYVELEEDLVRHKDHLSRLDKVLRCLDNDSIMPEELDELKEGMEAYLGGDEDESGIDITNVDEMYAAVAGRLEAVDNAIVPPHPKVSKGKEKEESEKEKEREKDKERERAAALAAKAQLIAQGNSNLGRQQAAQEEEAAERRSAGQGAAAAGAAAAAAAATGAAATAVPTARVLPVALGILGTTGAAGPRDVIPPSPRAAGAPPPPPPPHESLAANLQTLARLNSIPTTTLIGQNQVHGIPPPPGQPNFNLVPPQQQGRPTVAAAPVPAPAVTTWLTTAAGAGMNPAAADSSAFPQLGGGTYNQITQPGMMESSVGGPSVKGFIQKLQAGAGGGAAPAVTAAQQAQLAQQQRDASLSLPQQRHEAEEAALRQQQQRAAAQQPPVLQQQQLQHAQSGTLKAGTLQPAAAGGGGLLLGQRLASGPLYALAATGRESFDSVSSASQALPSTTASTPGGLLEKKQQAEQQQQQQQQQQGQASTQQQQQQQASAAAAAEAQKKGSQTLEVDRELLMRAAALVGSPELVLPTMTAVYPHHTAQQVLDSCYARARPQLPDTEWKRHKARNPSSTPPSFPRAPPDVVDNPALFRKMDPECLFFAFYFQPGSYQQFLAAHELKRQSWRFHKHHNAWFQRFTEPSVTSDEFEEGAYVYFDYNIVHDDLQAGWCYRRKERFTFRYDALEDELRVQPQAS